MAGDEAGALVTIPIPDAELLGTDAVAEEPNALVGPTGLGVGLDDDVQPASATRPTAASTSFDLIRSRARVVWRACG